MNHHKKLIDDTSALLRKPKLFVQISVPYFQPHQLAQLKHLAGDAGVCIGTPYPELVTFDFPNELEAEAAIERMQAAGFDDILIITDA